MTLQLAYLQRGKATAACSFSSAGSAPMKAGCVAAVSCERPGGCRMLWRHANKCCCRLAAAPPGTQDRLAQLYSLPWATPPSPPNKVCLDAFAHSTRVLVVDCNHRIHEPWHCAGSGQLLLVLPLALSAGSVQLNHHRQAAVWALCISKGSPPPICLLLAAIWLSCRQSSLLLSECPLETSSNT